MEIRLPDVKLTGLDLESDSILGGGGGGWPPKPASYKKNQFFEKINTIMQAIGPLPSKKAAMDLSPEERELRSFAMDRIRGAWGNDTKFAEGPFGRLLAAQSAAGTDAGIRDFIARTGASGSAAAAATASSLRAGGSASMHQAMLEARAQERSQVGGFLSFLSQSIGQQNQRGFEAEMFGAKVRADVVGGVLSRAHSMQQQGNQMRLAQYQGDLEQARMFERMASQMMEYSDRQNARNEAKSAQRKADWEKGSGGKKGWW